MIQHQLHTNDATRLFADNNNCGEIEQSTIADMPDLNDAYREEHDPRIEV
jgi:hypothetical protein